MRQSYCGRYFIDILTAMTTAAVELPFDISLIDPDIGLDDQGQDNHNASGSMDAAFPLRFRNALHAMDPVSL